MDIPTPTTVINVIILPTSLSAKDCEYEDQVVFMKQMALLDASCSGPQSKRFEQG